MWVILRLWYCRRCVTVTWPRSPAQNVKMVSFSIWWLTIEKNNKPLTLIILIDNHFFNLMTIKHNNLLFSILIDNHQPPILIRVRCSRMGKQDWFGQIPSRARQKPRHRGDICVTVSSKIDRLEQLQYLPQYHLHSSSEKVKTSSLC